MFYFTADHHFEHANIIRFTKRPFSTIEEMNGTLVDRWNAIVKNDDTVYHLGDFCLGGVSEFSPIVRRLNGHIHIVPGGHDSRWLSRYSWHLPKSASGHIVDVLPPLVSKEFSQIATDTGRPQTIVMCHYAMRVWDKSHYGSWHLYGHSHGNLPALGLSMDVGVDCNNFFPFSLEDISARMEKADRQYVIKKIGDNP